MAWWQDSSYFVSALAMCKCLQQPSWLHAFMPGNYRGAHSLPEGVSRPHAVQENFRGNHPNTAAVPKLAKFNLWLIKRRTKSVDQPIERDTYTRGSNNCSSVVAMRSVEVQVVECQQQDLFCFKGTACTIASAALLAESCHTSRSRIDNTTEPIWPAAASLPVGCRCWVRS